MYGEFDGGIELTDGEKNNTLKSYEKNHFGQQ